MITVPIIDGPSRDQFFKSFMSVRTENPITVTFKTVKQRSFTGIITSIEYNTEARSDDCKFIGLFNGVTLHGRYSVHTRKGQLEIKPAGADNTNKKNQTNFFDFLPHCY